LFRFYSVFYFIEIKAIILRSIKYIARQCLRTAPSTSGERTFLLRRLEAKVHEMLQFDTCAVFYAYHCTTRACSHLINKDLQIGLT